LIQTAPGSLSDKRCELFDICLTFLTIDTITNYIETSLKTVKWAAV